MKPARVKTVKPIINAHAALKLTGTFFSCKIKISEPKKGNASKTENQKSFKAKRHRLIAHDFTAPLKPIPLPLKTLILLAKSNSLVCKESLNGLIIKTAEINVITDTASKIFLSAPKIFTTPLQIENIKNKTTSSATTGTTFFCEPVNAALAESLIREFIASP